MMQDSVEKGGKGWGEGTPSCLHRIITKLERIFLNSRLVTKFKMTVMFPLGPVNRAPDYIK